MTTSRNRIPKYRHFKPRDLGVVRIDGKDIYLGRYDSPESWERYNQLIAEWLMSGGTHNGGVVNRENLSASQANLEARANDRTVNHILLAHVKFARTYYVRDGEPTQEVDGFRDSLRPVRQLYGRTQAEEFGPLRLKAVRQHMIDVQGLCRTEINKRVGRIKRAFNWAASEELISPSIAHGLQTVKGLRIGRTTARESDPVKPVLDEHVDAVLPFLPPQVAAMINIQRLTGMRPGETVIIRPCDIDRDRDVWLYRVPRHKNDWRGHDRVVAIGPKGQEILKPFLDRHEDAYLFSPREAYEWRLSQRQVCFKKARKTPIYPCELRRREATKKARRRSKKKCRIGGHYTTRSYWRALDYGFRRAKAEGLTLVHWAPNQLRHTRATELRKEYGIEGSRVSLGQAKIESTQIYAERDVALAIRIAHETG